MHLVDDRLESAWKPLGMDGPFANCRLPAGVDDKHLETNLGSLRNQRQDVFFGDSATESAAKGAIGVIDDGDFHIAHVFRIQILFLVPMQYARSFAEAALRKARGKNGRAMTLARAPIPTRSRSRCNRR